jgi:hypothetical protein
LTYFPRVLWLNDSSELATWTNDEISGVDLSLVALDR